MRKIKAHSLQKLEYFKKYLEAYLKATNRLPSKCYVDAFAGSGECEIAENRKKVDGSVMIALKASRAFDQYVFIEKKKRIFRELNDTIKNSTIDDKRKKSIELSRGDCNILLPKICDKISNMGCLIFLDPEGPELFWKTIISLSKIPKADLFILYPYDMSLARLIKNYKEKLDEFYGTDYWQGIYKNRKNANDAREKLLDFYISNLKTLGFRFVANKHIRTRLHEGRPLYHLILASHHPVAAKIMSQIFDKELDGQMKLKLYP
ncbi:MAG: three-Cys-motif partner protein TcmP [bacterium]|nr:three-Cys-motif partner protein TcmP [bacterium]